MRIGMAGLNALYWPVCIGEGLVKTEGVDFVAAATLGEPDSLIKSCMGLTGAEYARKYGVRLYVDAEEMAEREKLDAAVVISRHSRHAEWVEKLARHHVDIFIPKTMATAGEQLAAILGAEKEFGVRIAVGPTARYLPQMAAVLGVIGEGLIGEPFFARICHHHGTIDCFHDSDWYREPAEGGPELSLGWYGIDLALQLLGRKVRSVHAHYGNHTTPGSPFMDCGRISLGMEGGAMAAFDMYFCNRIAYPSWQLEVAGTKGVVSIVRKDALSVDTVVLLEDAKGARVIEPGADSPDWEMFWAAEFRDGKTPSVTAEYAAYVTGLTLLARESARTGRAVEA